MANQPVTREKLINADIDVDNLGKAVNEEAIVTPRYGDQYKSAPLAIKEIEGNGIAAVAALNAKADQVVAQGFYQGYTTEALLLAAKPAVAEMRARADDTRKIYRWTRTSAEGVTPVTGTWVDTGLSDKDLAAVDATTKANAAESNSKSLTKVATDIFDASAHSNNYSMTFLEAISSVPADLRKQGLTVRYNNADERTFVNNNTTNWLVQRLWIRQINTVAEGKVNHFDERMIYTGFIVGNSGVVETVDSRNKTAIIPIHREYVNGVEEKLNLLAYPVSLMSTTIGFIAADGTTITQFGGRVSLIAQTIPETAKYVFINLEYYSLINQVMTNVGNADIAKKYLHYFPKNNKPVALNSKPSDGFSQVGYGEKQSLIIDRTPAGDRLISPYFKETVIPVNGVHIAQFIKHVEFQKGRRDLINKQTGQLRRFYIDRISKNAAGLVAIQITFETEAGGLLTPDYGTTTLVAPSFGGLVNLEWVSSRDRADNFKVRVVVDPTHLPQGNNDFTLESCEIHPAVISKSTYIQNVNRGVQFTSFSDVGVAKTSSNMAIQNAQAVTLTKSMSNGVVSHLITGDSAKDHQQTTLIASKVARFAGKSNIYVSAKATYPNNPTVKMLRSNSSVSYNNAESITSNRITDLAGKTMDSQYVHPDICYAPEGVGGFKYWMINSNFPNGSEISEDADLFVSNDGTNWTRVLGFNEAGTSSVGFRNPEVFWNSDFKNAFMPIPKGQAGNTFEFAKESVIENGTVWGYLAHDPAISYHNGYINVYILYNLGLGSETPNHKYVVCYRTNNGLDWEIVREDGSTMPYNATNAMLIFTKTNGVRNHIRYITKGGGNITGWELSPQVVKVSDTEWYYYTRDPSNVTPTSGFTMNLIRYRGNNPYSFNFEDRQIVAKTNNIGGSLWHFGMQYIAGKFYCLFNGHIATSNDGLNFTVEANPFFWRGMSSDIYKPAFVLGHDGKIKVAYGIQVHFANPHPYRPQVTPSPINTDSFYDTTKVVATLLTEYSSITDIVNRSASPVADAYVDVIIASISQATKSVKINLVPCVRSLTEVTEALDVTYDDEIYVVVHLNTRNGGSLEFKGVATTLPSSAVH